MKFEKSLTFFIWLKNIQYFALSNNTKGKHTFLSFETFKVSLYLIRLTNIEKCQPKEYISTWK